MLKYLQRIGKSLLVPVAVLPAAALLLGVGYAISSVGDGGNFISSLLIASGDGILANLGLIFAIGVGFGMSKDNMGNAALTAIIFWLVTMKLITTPGVTEPITKLFFGAEAVVDPNRILSFTKVENTFIGIAIGLLSASIYNRTHKVELPDAFAFFSGRRLSPIVASLVAIPFALVTIILWPTIFGFLVQFGEFISGFGAIGAGLFGFFNRLLIPFGLHHALNQVFWFDLININDIPNFLSGDINGEGVILGVTGMYQAGFFPIMMFALPAAALAMAHSVDKKHRNKVMGIYTAGIVAAFVTGVTEPIEFLFLFISPMLFIIHAALTGLSLFIAASMEWIAGFGFSAGAIDLALSSQNDLAVKWYMLIIQGLVFAAIYYFVFKWAIAKFNIPVPGREKESTEEEDALTSSDLSNKIIEIIGKENFTSVDNCATRLRLEVKESNPEIIAELKKLNVLGVLQTSNKSIQIIIGPKVQFLADEIKGSLKDVI